MLHFGAPPSSCPWCVGTTETRSDIAKDRAVQRVVDRYLKQATQGDVAAQLHLGGLYRNGKWVRQNYREALKWYAMAAEQGHASAQARLGMAYHEGDGVPRNIVKAHAWMNLAATQGNKHAAEYRELLAKLITSAQLDQAQRFAADLHQRIEAAIGSRLKP